MSNDVETVASVLIIDDEDVIRAILQRKLELSGYSVVTAASAEEAVKYLAVTEFDLVLTDINMPGRSGIEILGQIREQYPHTAVILVTAVSDADTAIAAMKSGAYDYLVKPFNLEEVTLSIERALEKRQLLLENIDYQLNLERRVRERTSQLKAALRQVESTYEATLDALVCALDAREHETQAHSQRVRLYTLELARLLKYPMERINELGRGALLHDIGKIGVSDTILLKPGPLTADEWVEMRRHPEIGFGILTGISFL
ncbi:MAG: response regulator, partial [Myxococcales bacterium]|nr:response regulator [Myxococcales bacterium]